MINFTGFSVSLCILNFRGSQLLNTVGFPRISVAVWGCTIEQVQAVLSGLSYFGLQG